MQFSDSTNKQGIIEEITFLLGIGTAGYLLADRTRNINERFRQVWAKIFQSYGGWKYIDDNTSDASTGVPYADQNVTASTALYPLPSGALTVNGVEIKLTTNGSWQRLYPMTHEEFLQRGGDGAFTSTGAPTHYILQGDIIRLIQTPNFTLSSALRVFFDQGISTFAATDTTKTPGFASIFHRALSIGAALDYAMARGLNDKIISLNNTWEWYMGNEDRGKPGAIAEFYSKRWLDREPKNLGRGGRDLMREFS
jgi:hypothetical protein